MSTHQEQPQVSPEEEYALVKKLDDHPRRGVRRRVRAITAKSLDHISRIAFPVAYFIFNVIYWAVYLRPFKECPDEDSSCHGLI